jgi:hypothetical protein
MGKVHEQETEGLPVTNWLVADLWQLQYSVAYEKLEVDMNHTTNEAKLKADVTNECIGSSKCQSFSPSCLCPSAPLRLTELSSRVGLVVDLSNVPLRQ